MDCAIIVKHVRKPIFLSNEKRLSSRKFIRVAEIKSANSIRDAFTWAASSDTFQRDLDNSYLIAKIAKDLDIPVETVLDDLDRRKKILLDMTEHNIRDYRSVNRVLSRYYHNVENQTEPESENTWQQTSIR